jgi:single-strand DNA-binding protein
MAADINSVVLVGRLTRDAEMKYTAGGPAVCKFSIAVNRRKKSGDQWEDEANFFDVVLWGSRGEALVQYLLKGKLVGVEGELRQDRWQQDGQNRSKYEIVANNIQLLGGGSSGSGSGGNSYGPAQGSSTGQRNNDQGNSAGDDGFADDIPF